MRWAGWRGGMWLLGVLALGCGGGVAPRPAAASGPTPQASTPPSSGNPASPTAVLMLVGAPPEPTAPFTAHLDASASQPGTPGAAIASCSWSFGDGTTGEGCQTTHTFQRAGDFTVAATVVDSSGRSASQSLAVHVGAAASVEWMRAGLSGLVTDADGNLYSTDQGALVKLSPAGEELWRLDSPQVTPTAASRSFVYGDTLTTLRYGPAPTYQRVPADGSGVQAIGSGTDLTGTRTYAAPDDSRVGIAFTPTSTTLGFTGADGSTWSIAGGDGGAFFAQAAFGPDGEIIVSGRTQAAWTVQGQTLPAQTAFLIGLDRTGKLTWWRAVGDAVLSGLAVANDGTVFALAQVNAELGWGNASLAAGQLALLTLSPSHLPASARTLDGAQGWALAVDPAGTAAVMAGITGGTCNAFVRVLTFDAQLQPLGSRELRPVDCSVGSVEPKGIAFSLGHLVVNVRASDRVDVGGGPVSQPGALEDLIIEYR